jgi:hypothetical protein
MIKPEMLDVFFGDEQNEQVLSVPANLRRTNLQLEGGRAWLGLITATSDDPRQHACAPCIKSWKFNGGGAAESKSVDGWRNLRFEYQVRVYSRALPVRPLRMHVRTCVYQNVLAGGPPLGPSAAPGSLRSLQRALSLPV